jgi:hypothetical protein
MHVVIGGMIRSGSTFTFNVARETLLRTGTVGTSDGEFMHGENESTATHFVFKTHSAGPYITQTITSGSAKCICSIRKPEDALASFISIFHSPLELMVDAMHRWLTWYVSVAPSVLTIGYTAIDTAPQMVISRIENYLTGHSSEETSSAISQKYCKASLKARLDNLEISPATTYVDFSFYENETFFHRGHISAVESCAADTLLSPAQISSIRTRLKEFVDENGNVKHQYVSMGPYCSEYC